MSFVYTDYEVNDDSWARAGAAVDTQAYPEFAAWWAAHK